MIRSVTLWRASWIIATGALVAQWAYASSKDIDDRAHDRFSGDVRSTLARDARLNEQVMQARQSLVTHYDGLSRTTAELRETHKRLAEPPAFLERDSVAKVRASALEAEKALTDKIRVVESFKSENAIFRKRGSSRSPRVISATGSRSSGSPLKRRSSTSCCSRSSSTSRSLARVKASALIAREPLWMP